MDTKNRRWLLIISIVAIMGLLLLLFSVFEIIVLPIPWGLSIEIKAPWRLSRYPGMIPHIVLWPFSILLLLAIVPISYYFISRKLDEKLEKNLKIILKLINKENIVSETKSMKINNKEIIFKFLNLNERKVLEKLIEGKGTALQSEISLMEGMTKLKTHRAVKNLETKGIIKTESYGKTKRIILSEDIKDILLG
jgi:predicted transcriptional regulator